MNIVITGVSRGIGKAISKKMIHAGHHVLGISRNRTKLEQLKKDLNRSDHPPLFIPFPFDLNDFQDLHEEFISTVKAHFNQVDVLINNAGHLVNKPFLSLNFRDIQNSLSLNYTAPMLVTRSLLPLLKNSAVAHVVNIGTMGAVQGSAKFPGLSVYSSTKAALAGLTEVLAEEFKDMNIRFNYLALGAVQTEMLEAAFPGYKAPVTADEMADYITEFALKGWKYHNGKIIPVSLSTP